MAKYSPPGAMQVKPQDLLVPTTYNPYSVPTFLEESCQFVDQCPVHPNSTTARLGASNVAPPVIRNREVSQRSTGRSPQRRHHNDKSATDGKKIAYHHQQYDDHQHRAGAAEPQLVRNGFEGSPVTSYGAPTFRTNSHHHNIQQSAGFAENAHQYYNVQAGGAFGPGGAFVPPSSHHAPSWKQQMTAGDRLMSPPAYTPTYPTADHQVGGYQQQAVVPLNVREQSPSATAAAHHQGGRNLPSRQSGGMVDVLNASTSEGYTTVSALRHMRPATKQCC